MTDVIGVGCTMNNVGNRCFGEKERGKVWESYMEAIMNEEYDWVKNVDVDMACGSQMRISEMEVQNVIKALKLGKTYWN